MLNDYRKKETKKETEIRQQHISYRRIIKDVVVEKEKTGSYPYLIEQKKNYQTNHHRSTYLASSYSPNSI
ncbi:hypothetical protein DERP_005334 [Dermatophagoides pteronyssinus]|uniref:Uncharacterized protein n=1 Tax=Dermatophagoides pteronyssinus TaxID=6956 RepID=A0ABQ8JMW4_DERPT|nr:hypothetical protein DERP_005334 [Dermatophagoides pteronyssinus]